MKTGGKRWFEKSTQGVTHTRMWFGGDFLDAADLNELISQAQEARDRLTWGRRQHLEEMAREHDASSARCLAELAELEEDP